MESQFQPQTAERAEVQKPNLTGIPTQMKLDFERRSGLSFDDVRVHYHSDKPRRLGALAYTQGNQVYMGPGQEQHLSHELGHVIQQKAGRVRPTGWIGGLPVNNQPELEREADLGPVKGMPAQEQHSVVQMYTDEEVVSLMARFAARGWTELGISRCVEILEKVEDEGEARIGHHCAVLRRLKNGVLRIQKRRFHKPGASWRTTEAGGAVCDILEIFEEFEFNNLPDSVDVTPLPPKYGCGSISLTSSPSVSSRVSLNSVMGGSAASLSEIANAEYLHIIAHQLGGPDDEANLMVGLHALNTAMIPFENLVADLARAHAEVFYSVILNPRPGISIWASSADITISATLREHHYSKSLRLDIVSNYTEPLSSSSYAQAVAYANEFLRAMGL